MEKNGILKKVDQILLCNDSVEYIASSLATVFKQSKTHNFYGITKHAYGYSRTDIKNNYSWIKQPHLQSYFLILSNKIFNEKYFKTFMHSITKEVNKKEIIIKYEMGLSKVILENGFSLNSYYPCEEIDCDYMEYYLNKKSEYKGERLFSKLKFENSVSLTKLKYNREIRFSIIMPTFNRAFCIENAIESLLNQTYQNYELIIVDDGSTDGTEKLLKKKYKEYFDNKKFIYKYKKNEGVCKARNVGLKLAHNEWIAYLDTDNQLVPSFLEEFSNIIASNAKTKCFYAQVEYNKERFIGKEFNYEQLCKSNYIDLDVFVHHK